MTKLRAEKVEKIADSLPPLTVEGDPDADLLIVGFEAVSGISFETAITTRADWKMFRNHGLVYVISDTKYVKDKAAGIILELKPGAGEKVKEGRTVYLTVNTLDVPLRAIPDVADNSSLRQAQAKLLNAGFKLNQVQLVNGEKDWVYGVKYQGRQLAAGEKIPLGASLTLMVGDGSGDMSEEEDSVDVSVDTEKPVTSESSPAQDDSWF